MIFIFKQPLHSDFARTKIISNENCCRDERQCKDCLRGKGERRKWVGEGERGGGGRGLGGRNKLRTEKKQSAHPSLHPFNHPPVGLLIVFSVFGADNVDVAVA